MGNNNDYIFRKGNSIRNSDLLTLINGMSSAIILVKLDIDDTAGKIMCVNNSAAKLIGKPASELLKESAHSIFLRDDITLPMNRISYVEGSNLPFYQKKLFRENGEIVNVEVESNLVQMESDEQYLLLTLKDITEELNLQKKLEESLKQFESLFQNNPDVTFSINPVGAFTNMNVAGARILEYSMEELIGKSFRDLIAAEDLEITDNYFFDVLKGSSAEFKISVVQKSGNHIKMDITAVPIVMDFEVVGVIGIARNINEQTKMEQLLKESEQRYRSLFEYNVDPVITFDLEGNFLAINKATETLMGYVASDLLGKPFLPFISPEKQEETMNQFSKVLKGEPHQYETTMINSYGERVLLYITVIPIFIDRKLEGIHCIGKDITAFRKNEEKIREMAYGDLLTGIGNQRLFHLELSQSIERRDMQHHNVALLLVDLDRFKFINDYLGHNMGDLLLTKVANRIRFIVNGKGKVYRYAGDEFTIILEDTDDAILQRIAREIIEEISKPIDLDGFETVVTASIGISVYPRDSRDAEGLLNMADHAMYYAKRQGRNNYQIYANKTMSHTPNNLKMETLLHKALEKKELLLHYQPQVNAKTKKIGGIEALLRWENDILGMVSPVDFIPLAEETGMIIPIGEWVISEACRQNKEWQKQGLPAVPVSVNLSLRQFYQTDLVEKISWILEETQLKPEYLELEITESIAVQPDTAIQVLNDLKALGIKIAIDDFGTGYSSLNHLRRFPIDHLKIDRAFVKDIQQDEDDRNIIATIIALGHNLKLEVIAEGVETQEQVEFLQSLSCDMLQGYLFSKPIEARTIPEVFRKIF